MTRDPSRLLCLALFCAATGLTIASCSSDSGSGSGSGSSNTNFTIYLSQNGSTNAGMLTVTDSSGNVQKTMTTGGNEGVFFDGTDNLVHANDQATLTNSLVLINKPFLRASGSNFQTAQDGTIFPDFSGGNPKGVIVIESRNLALVANFRGRTTGGNIVGVSLSSRGSSTTPISPVFTTANFTQANTNISGLTGLTETSPWDMVFDEPNDRLYVALTEGTVAVFDNFFGAGLPNGRSANRFFRPPNSTNLHGIQYDAANDFIVVTDVGPVTSGANNDGVIYVVASASSSSGNVGAVSIFGASTFLGNPVDLVLNSGDVNIAEKTQNFFLNFGPLVNLTQSGGFSPVGFNNDSPESLAIQTGGGRDFVDVSDTTNPNNIAQLVVVDNPADNNGGTENTVSSFSTSLAPTTNSFTIALTQTVPNSNPVFSRLRSLESVAFDNRGNMYVSYGNDNTAMGATAVGEGGVAVASLPFRAGRVTSTTNFNASLDHARLTGANTTLLDPKGMDVTDARNRGSRVFIADFGAGTVVVYGSLASADVAPLGRTTDLGSAGRRPWDLDYDPIDDRLFVACTDGTIAVFDNYLINVEGALSPPGPNRVIMPTYNNGISSINAVNFHGIVYDRNTNTIIVSDVGVPGNLLDGFVLTIETGASADGVVPASRTLGGNNTGLGDPVDLAYDGTNLYIAEKGNGLIMRYNSFLSVQGTINTAPNASDNSLQAPESIGLLTTNTSTLR